MFQKYVDILSNCCKQAFTEMTKTIVRNIRVESITEDPENYKLAHKMMYLDHDTKVHGDFILAFGEETIALNVASEIAEQLGIGPFDTFNDDVEDILNEFINVIVGHAVTQWDQSGFSVKFGTPAFKKALKIKGEPVAHAYKIILDLESNKVVLDENTQHEIVLRVTFTEPGEQSILKDKKVLVVEDSRVLRNILAKTLEENSCKVKEAKNGEEAIVLHQVFKPDLTVMDLNMPKMGGLDAMVRIREKYPDARFLVLTSSCRTDEVVTAKTVGVIDYIIKPVKPDVFL